MFNFYTNIVGTIPLKKYDSKKCLKASLHALLLQLLWFRAAKEERVN